MKKPIFKKTKTCKKCGAEINICACKCSQCGGHDWCEIAAWAIIVAAIVIPVVR